MAQAIQFQLSESSSASALARCGSLYLINKPQHKIETPAFLTNTLHGSVPHLTADNLGLLPTRWLQVSIEHFIGLQNYDSLEYPKGLHKYLNLEDYLLFCDLRDPASWKTLPFSTDKYMSVETQSGVQRVTPEVWAKAIQAYRPDMCAPLADVLTEQDATPRKITRSVDRTLRWLDTCLSVAHAIDIPVFGHLVGQDDVEERARSAEQTATRDVQGFTVHLNGTTKDPASLIQASVSKLLHDKPRLAYGLSTPELVLTGVANGIDLFDSSYAQHMTDNGHAIVFKFGESSALQEPRSKTLSIWDTSMQHDFEPIDPHCGCHACSTPHTKAYIHHLLNAHEMLASVLLMSHNLYQLDQFMTAIRNSIEKGKFDHDRDIFMRQYRHEDDVEDSKTHEEEISPESLGVSVKKSRIRL